MIFGTDDPDKGDAIDPAPAQVGTQPHLSPLAAMSAKLLAELEAAGFNVIDRPQSDDRRLTATFVPRRKPKQSQ